MQLCEPDIMGRLNELGKAGVPARLGILGGTFDPIHLGHVRIAEEVREKLHLDGVLFIPAGVPVFKKGQEIAPAQERLEQVRRVVANNPHFGVCNFEVQRTGDTYTVDTLRALRRVYPACVQFFFIVGADAAPSLPQWRSVDELATLATFVVADGRPGGAAHGEIEAVLERQMPELSVEYVAVRALDISSHEVRKLARADASVRYLVPEAIRVEVMHRKQRGDFAKGSASGALDGAYTNEFFEVRLAELRTRVSEKRFAHCEAVSDTAIMLAQRYDVSADAARLAGLLHDWDKGYDDEGIRARVRELGMEDEIDPLVVQLLPGTLHGMTAARALAREFVCIPREVIQAISRHTVAHEHMEPLDMVLYVADAIEPSRQFGRVDELRALVNHVTLEELFFETYRYWTSLLLERNRMLHPDTIRIWNTYSARLHPKTRRQES